MIVDPTGWTLADFAAAYRSGESVTTVIEATLALLADAPDAVLISAPLRERALADAAALDAGGPDDATDAAARPLFGVPFVVKDNIDVAHHPTTAGCPGYEYVAAADATVVALLRSAGAVVVGKTNLDQFATGLVGTRSPYGSPLNTLDPGLVPGGSSSGSAVSVALGLVPFALGTDTAGSGRVPAALNGIVGIKPTLGRVSTYGIVPAMRRFDCPSVFARNVADAETIATTLSVLDRRDPFMPTPLSPSRFHDRPVVGVPATWPERVELSDEMARRFDESVAALAGLGCEIVSVDIEPLLDVGALLYGSALVAERSAAVGEAVDKGVAGLDPVVATIIGRGNEISAVDAYRTEYELTLLRATCGEIWNGIDVLALPTTPQPATREEVDRDPFGRNEMLGRLTTFVNLLDLAAIVVPMRPRSDAVPAGLQLIAPAWQDSELARLAQSFESGALVSAPQHECTVVVVGAHLRGLPLHHQLTDRRATFGGAARTSADYRLYALAGTVPAKPGLVRCAPGDGAEIEVELWSMGPAEFGSFVDGVPAPLSIGTIALSDGRSYKGFLCEPIGLAGATDITSFGGWRAYLA